MARLCLVSLVLALMILCAAAASPVHAQQWLADGGFETGGDAWLVSGGSSAACEPHQGSGALGVGVSGQGEGKLSHQLEGQLTATTYTLSGWTRIQSGAGTVKVVLGLVTPSGAVRGIAIPEPIPSGPQYTPFSVSTSVGFVPESVYIVLSVATQDGAELCIDSLQLTTPDPTPGPSATPTATPEPTTTSTPAASATATAAPTRAPSASATVPSGPSFVFANGGFEQGLAGWQKYGGTLTTTSAAHSGNAAGLLTSSTDSTKWAFQPLAIKPRSFYEFSAYVAPDAGVIEALLRISWYPTGDSSGSAMATTDSIGRVAGGSNGYAFLTTGPVQAPDGAATARVRVLMTPAGAGAATLRIDDVAFLETSAPTATPSSTPTPSQTPDATATATGTPSVPLLGALPTLDATAAGEEHTEPAIGSTREAVTTNDHPDQTDADSPLTSLFAQVAAVRFGPAKPGESVQDPPSSFATPDEGESNVPWPWVLGFGLVIVGVGGAYMQHRQSAR